jgi:hypothetical protein
MRASSLSDCLATDLTFEAVRGRWELTAWDLRVGETLIQPLGDHPQGVIYYSDDGWMAVQILAPDRRAIASIDPLGGTEEERAAAYATCLSYCGTYTIGDGHIVHNVQLSTFPNWVGEQQVRYAELQGNGLVLRAAPIKTPAGVIENELRWVRPR